MLRLLLTSILLTMSLTMNAQTSVDNSIHQFKVADIYGNIFDFSELKGKKVMIVNTASKCGLTYQYEALQNLYLMRSLLLQAKCSSPLLASLLL